MKNDHRSRILRCHQPHLTYDVCGRLLSQSGFCHHQRTFNRHVLILLLEGTLHITANGSARDIRAGEYLFLRAGEEHYGHQPTAGKLNYLWVHLTDDSRFDPCDSVDEDCPYTFAEYGDAAHAPRLASRFQQLIDLSLEETAYPAFMMDCAASMLLMELTRLQMQPDPSRRYPPAILAATEWIRRHYHQPFTVAELAQHVGYQPDYLSSLFKRSVGVSIVTYANQLRLRMAKALLAGAGTTIKEAAYSCGFPDEKYFMRLFKRQEGMTPSQFRSLQVK